jgi:probable phosphoglycerate mutase
VTGSPDAAVAGFAQLRYERPDAATEVLLIRHGESAPLVPGDASQLLDGQSDPMLTDLGRRQAEAVAAKLGDEPIEANYVSSLRRTAETAAPLAARLGLEPVVIPDLREVSLGEWEGGLHRQYEREGNEVAKRVIAGDWDDVPGAETRAAFARRLTAAIDRIVLEQRGSKVAVFTHSGAIAHILGSASNGDAEAFLGADNGSISEVVYAGGPARVRRFNLVGSG